MEEEMREMEMSATNCKWQNSKERENLLKMAVQARKGNLVHAFSIANGGGMKDYRPVSDQNIWERKS